MDRRRGGNTLESRRKREVQPLQSPAGSNPARSVPACRRVCGSFSWSGEMVEKRLPTVIVQMVDVMKKEAGR